MSLLSLLQINKENRCVSVCGSGGKSTLCYALAAETLQAGRRAAVTTTTHIAFPDVSGTVPYLTEDREELRSIVRFGRVPVAGKRDGSKLCYGGEEMFRILLEETDTLFVEADGSKMLPLKFPNATEPAVPASTDTVIAVCGLSALGRPLEEVCHRLPLARAALPQLGETADADAIASILWKGYGRFSPVFVLNQADSDRQKEAGEEIKGKLELLGAKRVCVISLRENGFREERYF